VTSVLTNSDWLILNVDDQQAMRYAKTRTLLRAGFKVLEASNGAQALESVETHAPALILCDIKMPDMSGHEVSRVIKQKHPNIVVLQISSSFTTGQDRVAGLDVADSYLIEPVEPEELIATVQALLRLKKAENDLRLERDQRDFIIGLANALRALETPDAVIQHTLEALGPVLKLDSADLFRVVSDGAPDLGYRWRAQSGLVAVGTAPQGMEPTIQRRLRAGETVLLDKTDGDERERRGGASLVIVPILRGERWQATLKAERALPSTWSESELSLVREVAELSWDSSERAQATYDLKLLNASLADQVAERTKELMHSEAQLRQSQKMEAVGQLAGGIAHDFNNLLTGIIGGLNLVRRRIARSDPGDVDRIMDAVESSANRAAALTKRMLAFSRLQPLQLRPVDVNELIAAIADMLRRSIGENIELSLDLQESLCLANTDSNQLETAILNLVINARDAMPNGGCIKVKTQDRRIDDDAERPPELRPGDYVVLSVVDNGTGMSDDTTARIFEPFFTTKPLGQGTGLGLSMVYGFVKQSEGHISVESELGRGTNVSLYLPRHYGTRGEISRAEHEQPMGARFGEVILLAEDDPSVRLLLVDLLSELRYRVIVAPDGNQAVRHLKSDIHIDLLLTDIGLPGPNGQEVAEQARISRQGLPILFITGYEGPRAKPSLLVGDRMDLISKPFDLDHLASRIRAMLDS
jgi:signal transduction histidine kinase/DNA-binding response OmpR family regulator